MGKSPSQFEETIQHQFDRLCKLALKGEKIDYIRHMEYLRKNEVMLSELSQKELDQLAIYDEYDLESYKFQVLNYDIEVKDALIAEALTSLTKRKRDVILLSYLYLIILILLILFLLFPHLFFLPLVNLS